MLSGKPSPASLTLQRPQAAGVLYLLQTHAAVSEGLGTAGIAFFDAGGEIIAAPAMDLHGANATAHTMRVSAPQGSMAVSVFVGKFDGAGGRIEVCPGCQNGRYHGVCHTDATGNFA